MNYILNRLGHRIQTTSRHTAHRHHVLMILIMTIVLAMVIVAQAYAM